MLPSHSLDPDVYLLGIVIPFFIEEKLMSAQEIVYLGTAVFFFTISVWGNRGPRRTG